MHGLACLFPSSFLGAEALEVARGRCGAFSNCVFEVCGLMVVPAALF